LQDLLTALGSGRANMAEDRLVAKTVEPQLLNQESNVAEAFRSKKCSR
jgi:hypothetical protein